MITLEERERRILDTISRTLDSLAEPDRKEWAMRLSGLILTLGHVQKKAAPVPLPETFTLPVAA